jgi:hypothetical protein
MKIFKKATLHPCLGNEYRDEVKQWCSVNISDDRTLCTVNSNYDDDGDFEVNVLNRDNRLNNDGFLMMFMLKFPTTKVLNLEYAVIAKVEDDTINTLFEKA